MVFVEREQAQKVSKMTDLELAKIEADEMHPLYEAASAEIDIRMQSNGKRHTIDVVNDDDAWNDSFARQREREMDRLFEDGLVAAMGHVDPASYAGSSFEDERNYEPMVPFY
jgi:hypothetical protein